MKVLLNVLYPRVTVLYADSGALQSAYRLINDMTAAGARGPAPGSASELYVVCAEAGVQVRLRQRFHCTVPVHVLVLDTSPFVYVNLNYKTFKCNL